MKKLIGVFLLSLPMLATASNCDEISAKIAEKIKNNGVDPAHFQLKLESADKSEQQIEGKIVGSCDRGQQHIVYVRLDGVIKEPSQPTQPMQQQEPEPEQTTPVQSDESTTN
ncbi:MULTISPECIES: DUF1161 domain-containing protein [unclassified Gilliamella]|uniref:DUF1161 domain-containing protein n=1 Tax=unclassified Gilliamella TaxID=2685620 RepID=UPI0013246195|nr:MULTISPECIES: DUF1161 domain-containing protein [unclassified Gilliamella]MWN32515.1 DUF1161 domain-containing protein [Gilliamella sp. Pra-s60]MWP29923.1 DUF1161 domain-containing protein [Gilliamella sp. Pra-s54]